MERTGKVFQWNRISVYNCDDAWVWKQQGVGLSVQFILGIRFWRIGKNAWRCSIRAFGFEKGDGYNA